MFVLFSIFIIYSFTAPSIYSVDFSHFHPYPLPQSFFLQVRPPSYLHVLFVCDPQSLTRVVCMNMAAWVGGYLLDRGLLFSFYITAENDSLSSRSH